MGYFRGGCVLTGKQVNKRWDDKEFVLYERVFARNPANTGSLLKLLELVKKE